MTIDMDTILDNHQGDEAHTGWLLVSRSHENICLFAGETHQIAMRVMALEASQ